MTFVDAGHILGSASVILDYEEANGPKRLVFSGDIGRRGLPIIRDPEPPEQADVVIMESTYGDRDHAPYESARNALARIVTETAARGGRIGYRVRPWRARNHLRAARTFAAGAIPRSDLRRSPLAIEATLFETHPEIFDRTEDCVQQVQSSFGSNRLTIPRARVFKARQHWCPMSSCSVRLAEPGASVHHLSWLRRIHLNTILSSLSRSTPLDAQRRRQPMCRSTGRYPSPCSCCSPSGYSALRPYGLTKFLDAVRATSPALRNVYLVHGEPGPRCSPTLYRPRYAVTCPSICAVTTMYAASPPFQSLWPARRDATERIPRPQPPTPVSAQARSELRWRTSWVTALSTTTSATRIPRHFAMGWCWPVSV